MRPAGSGYFMNRIKLDQFGHVFELLEFKLAQLIETDRFVIALTNFDQKSVRDKLIKKFFEPGLGVWHFANARAAI